LADEKLDKRALSPLIVCGQRVMKLHSALILFVVVAFIVASAYSLSMPACPISREEAIEISKQSELVRKGLADAHNFEVEATYYNSSMVEKLKAGHLREIFQKVPEGHSVWNVGWTAHKTLYSSTILVLVDAETAAIIDERGGPVLW